MEATKNLKQQVLSKVAYNEKVLLPFGHLKFVTPKLLLIAELLLMFCSITKFITSSWN
jgi:hypothetical protein